MNPNFMEFLVVPLGWTLLHFVWQGLLIGLLHEAAIRFIGSTKPERRYAVSLAGLLALALAPLITFGILWANADAAGSLPADATAAVPTSPLLATAQGDEAAAPLLTLDTWLPFIVLVWLTGVAMLSLRFGIGLLALRNLIRHADFEAVSDWMHEELRRLIALMRVSRPVRIALSTQVSSPLVVGWLRPVILLPLSAATGLDHQQIRMVLAHELAHLRRYDHFINLLQVVVETLLFYHPAVHRISRSLRQDREQCCDDLAISIGGNPLAYARVLAELEEMRQEGRRALALGIADQELYTRIERLVSGNASRSPAAKWMPVALLALAGLGAVSQTIDTDAPLLPAMLERAIAYQQIDLDLPPAASPTFKPIVNNETTAASSEQDRSPSPVETPAQRRADDVKIRHDIAASVPAETRKATEKPVQETPVQQSTPDQDIELDKSSAPGNELATAPQPAKISGGELAYTHQPVYPRRALRVGKEGHVELAFTVATDGSVKDVAVLAAEPRGMFENAAMDAIRQWRFTPFMVDGRAVAKRVSQVMEFRLSNEPQRRTGTAFKDCREQTGTRLCRGNESADTQLKILDE